MDDASTDGTRQVAEKLADHVITTGNHLFGENDMVLMENSSSPYLLLLPGDAILMKDPSPLLKFHTEKVIATIGRLQHGFRQGGSYYLCKWYTSPKGAWCTNACCMFNVKRFLEVTSTPRIGTGGKRRRYRGIAKANDLWFWRYAHQADGE